MTSPTPSAEMDDPNVRDDIAGCCDAWAEASDRCGLPKRAAAMRDLALELRRPSDPVRAEMVEHATIPNVANLVDIALQDAMVDAPGGSTYDDNLFVKALADTGLAITRPTSTRREVLEEAAKVAHEHREKGPWMGQELVVWRRACAQVEDHIRALSLQVG